MRADVYDRLYKVAAELHAVEGLSLVIVADFIVNEWGDWSPPLRVKGTRSDRDGIVDLVFKPEKT